MAPSLLMSHKYKHKRINSIKFDRSKFIQYLERENNKFKIPIGFMLKDEGFANYCKIGFNHVLEHDEHISGIYSHAHKTYMRNINEMVINYILSGLYVSAMLSRRPIQEDLVHSLFFRQYQLPVIIHDMIPFLGPFGHNRKQYVPIAYERYALEYIMKYCCNTPKDAMTLLITNQDPPTGKQMFERKLCDRLEWDADGNIVATLELTFREKVAKLHADLNSMPTITPTDKVVLRKVLSTCPDDKALSLVIKGLAFSGAYTDEASIYRLFKPLERYPQRFKEKIQSWSEDKSWKIGDRPIYYATINMCLRRLQSFSAAVEMNYENFSLMRNSSLGYYRGDVCQLAIWTGTQFVSNVPLTLEDEQSVKLLNSTSFTTDEELTAYIEKIWCYRNQ